MNHRKTSQRFLAMALSAVMLLGLLPVTALADDSAAAGGEIVAFAALPEATAAQTVALGTTLADLNLPETLTATVRVASSSDSAQDSGASASDPEYTESTADVPVTWTASPDYDGDTAGTYVFTAETQGYTVSATAPAITVTVQEAAVKGTITAFDELADDVRWQNTTSPVLPETLTGTVAGQTVQIPVTWEADHDYDADSPESGLYVFTATPGDGYALTGGVETPLITAYIPAAAKLKGSLKTVKSASTISVAITTAAQLEEVSVLVNAGRLETFLVNDSSATVTLTLASDLDLSAYGKNWNSGAGWEPIGTDTNPFKGIFDGNGYAITGLTIIGRTDNYTGLFGDVSGMVQNLGLEGVSVSGGWYTGGVAGCVDGGSVTGCYVTGAVSGTLGTGGMAGVVTDSGSVTSCYAASVVTGTSNDTGGVAGAVDTNGSMTDCYATGAVTGTINVGGVAGDVEYHGSVTNCYATGAVSGTQDVGGVAGKVGNGSVTGCAALNPSVSNAGSIGRVAGLAGGVLSGNVAFSGMTDSDGTVIGGANSASGNNGADVTAAQIAQADFWTTAPLSWDSTVWTIAANGLPILTGIAADVQDAAIPAYLAGGSSPYFLGSGTSDAPYRISTAAQLEKLAELVNAGDTSYNSKYYKLTENLDLSGYGASFNSGAGWTPIGTGSNRFKGSFDGNSKTITGLTISRTAANIGLFGYVSGGTVKDLGLKDVSISGGNYTGGVAGYVSGSGSVTNCYVTGAVSGACYVGGVAGCVDSGSSVTGCYTTSTVSSTGEVGGVVGYFNGGNVTNCYATGAISGLDTVGGVAGYIYSGNVTNCYAIGTITASVGNAGGVAGNVSGGSVKNCAALNPSVSGGTDKAGRVAGYIYGAPLSGNAAFSGMTVTENSTVQTISDGAADNKNGADITADSIKADGTIGSRFIDTNGWTVAAGSLPILKNVGGTQDASLPYYISGSYFTGAGTSDAPYQIGTAAQLEKLAELVNAGDTNYNDKCYKLTADLDLSAYGKSFNSGAGWTPIGTDSNRFKGSFDGNSKTITGLYISRADDFTGLFGYVNGGTVKDLGLKDVSISGGNYTGGVAGYASQSSVTSCYATGTVTGGNGVGGVAGAFIGSIENCYATAAVSGTGECVGGMVGQIIGSVINCYATGAVTGKEDVGGVVGRADTGFGVTSSVKNCAALNPSVSGTSSLGRVAGCNIGTLSGNRAFSGMTGGGSSKSADNLDGADITAAQILTASFWTTAGNWDSSSVWDTTSVWTITDGKLPILKNAGGTQSGDGGLYLTVHDIANATATVAGSYTYTGSPISPALSVTFDGAALTQGTDYTYAIASADDTAAGTSAGTNAGTVTLTLTGKGNFTGTKTVTYTIGGTGGSTDDPSGGGSSGSSTTTTTPTTTEKQPNLPVTAAVSVTATAGTNGASSATIPDKTITDAIAKAQADAKTEGKTSNGISVELNITAPKGTTALSATLSQTALKALVDAGVTSLQIGGLPINVSFDQTALRTIQSQSSGNVTITAAVRQNLSGNAKTMIGTRPVYNITVGYGSNSTVTNLGGGTATVSIPYTPAAGEAAGYLYGVYVDGSGNATRIDGSAYDANSGCLIFNTGHLSIYGVGYTAPSAKFTDVSGHWAKDSIDYVVGRGLLAGTSDTAFTPNTVMTRGMLVTALGRLSGVDTKLYTTNSFTDVKAGSTFQPYIEWAYQKGIIQGIGNSQFAPDRAVTREEIAVILQNYAKATGYTLPVTRVAVTFADDSSIGSAYKDAVKAMQQAGIMQGGNNNVFSPGSSATRAEVAAMLTRYIKLTIDPATAQGWAKNDSGQWMYFKEGKALTGWQTVNGKVYCFDSSGGAYANGWKQNAKGEWFFLSSDGSAVTGWKDIGANGSAKRYYFDANGVMVAGKWLEIDGKWYYFYSDGSLAVSTTIDGYEVDKNGVRKSK